MTKKSIVFYVLAVLFFCSIFSGGGVGAVMVAIVLTALFCFLGFRSMKKKPVPQASEPVAQEPVKAAAASPYDFVNIKVAGVTYKNGRKTRQAILRAIKFRDNEFSEGVELELRPYEWEGQPAYGVYANDQQIGSVPTDMVKFVTDNYQRIDAISNIEVYGGGRDEDMNVKNYGCEITLRLKKN